MKTNEELLRDAVNAATAIRQVAEDLRGRATIGVDEFANRINSIQHAFDRVKPLLQLTVEEVQQEARRLFGHRAPADVFGLVAEAQAAGARVVEVAHTQVYDPDVRAAHASDLAAGVYHRRNLAGTDLGPLATPLDELIAALGPVAG